MSDTLQFKVSSALKDLVGKDLITSDNVAIFELVKNSYDAYANHVIITFSEDKITIDDNGKGMSYADLRDKWLFLGFSAKKDGTEVILQMTSKNRIETRLSAIMQGRKELDAFLVTDWGVI